MKITVKDIIEKYDTTINLKNVSNKLKNLVLFTDDENHRGTSFDGVSYDDIKEPIHTVNKNNEQYTYAIKMVPKICVSAFVLCGYWKKLLI